MRGQGHDPPVTVLAEDELPVLADPVDSDEEELLDAGDGVAVLVATEVEEDDDVDVPVVVPACVCAATIANAATATVPNTPDAAVSLPRSRSALLRWAGVRPRF
jgi:hypothetical protein